MIIKNINILTTIYHLNLYMNIYDRTYGYLLNSMWYMYTHLSITGKYIQLQLMN